MFRKAWQKVNSLFVRSSGATLSSRNRSQMSMDHVMKEIYTNAIHAVVPANLIRSQVNYCPANETLEVSGKTFILKRNVSLIGFGKAVLGMAVELHKMIGGHIVDGILSVPVGSCQRWNGLMNNVSLFQDRSIKIYEGAKNNLPDELSEIAAQEILELCQRAGKEDLVIALVSGGGSALLSLPVDGITIQEKREAVDCLSKAGATIEELNAVRQIISKVKGGKLAHHTFPAEMLSLIISDVIGDPIEFIASGPTVMQQSFNSQFLTNTLKKFESTLANNKFPAPVKAKLEDYFSPVMNNSCTKNNVSNFLIGNNVTALQAAANTAEKYGYESLILSNSVEGEVSEVGKHFAQLTQMTFELVKHGSTDRCLETMAVAFNSKHSFASKLQELRSKGSKKVCLLCGGEPTVSVSGTGRGGRNQELCLYFSKHCSGLGLSRDKVRFVSIGTDGQDGPTDAAGAIVDPYTWQHADKLGLNPSATLENNDSYTLLSKLNEGKHLIQTGLTGTNVMDLQILLLEIN